MDQNEEGMKAFWELAEDSVCGRIINERHIINEASKNFRLASVKLVNDLRVGLVLRDQMMREITTKLKLADDFYIPTELYLANGSYTHADVGENGSLYVTFGLLSVHEAMASGEIELVDLRGHQIVSYEINDRLEAIAYDTLGMVMQCVEDYGRRTGSAKFSQRGLLWVPALRVCEDVVETYIKENGARAL